MIIITTIIRVIIIIMTMETMMMTMTMITMMMTMTMTMMMMMMMMMMIILTIITLIIRITRVRLIFQEVLTQHQLVTVRIPFLLFSLSAVCFAITSDTRSLCFVEHRHFCRISVIRFSAPRSFALYCSYSNLPSSALAMLSCVPCAPAPAFAFRTLINSLFVLPCPDFIFIATLFYFILINVNFAPNFLFLFFLTISIGLMFENNTHIKE